MHAANMTNLHVESPFSSPMIVGLQFLDRLMLPGTLFAKARNTFLDAFFYDVRNLTATERYHLVWETNREGSILIVWPSGAKGDMGVKKFRDHQTLRAEPGALLTRFAIAGVGSSDVGAAAFARIVANRYQEPVGAIIAGYGGADLLAEAMGGWLFLRAANQSMNMYNFLLGEAQDFAEALQRQTKQLRARQAREAATTVVGLNDSDTLLRLLLDDDRHIASVAGHSKGSLSIAYALQGLAATRRHGAIERARAMRVTTAGAIVALPSGFDNAGQYLGSLDGFGRLNSRFGVSYTAVPMAWHHLNTFLPLHMDFAAVMAQEPD